MAGGSLRGEARRRARSGAVLLLAAGALAACASVQAPSPMAGAGGSSSGLHGTDKPYQVNGQWYYPKADPRYDEVGLASWYGYPFHMRRTANGELFDQNQVSAAHKTLPLPCIVEVTNLDNGRRLKVRVNDRGPFVDGRLIDVSRAAAEQLGFDRKGLTRVRVRYVSPAPPLVEGMEQASYSRPSVVAPAAPISQPDAADQDWDEAAAPYGYQQGSAAPTYAPPSHELPPRADGTQETATAAPVAGPSTITTAALPPVPTDGAAETADAAPAPSEPMVEAAPPASQFSPPAPAEGGYAIQAGAYSSRAAADRVAAQLAEAGEAQVLAVQRNGETLYRVTVGAFPNPAAAAEARARVIAGGFSDARVVQAF
ncbi:MAG: septal ring lytic transglycosylase RlpA family protein [Caulobacteraceae bacterium]|nr:septal ring lytic transglycosylase RlpA family protein [Caulobacteraceae bacterium]